MFNKAFLAKKDIKKSQVRTMTKLKRYLVNLKLNDLQVIIAITMIAIGGSLWYDRHYFFWPPNLQSALNDWRIDIFILLVGIVLFFATAFRPDDTFINSYAFSSMWRYCIRLGILAIRTHYLYI